MGVWMLGCCGRQHTDPPYPQDVYGWRDYKEGTNKLRGCFVLKEGASTDNGKVKITVLKILAPECTGDAGDFSARARVTLQFCSFTDQKVLCEETFPESGGLQIHIPDEFGISGVGVRGINLREAWVFFILTGDY